MPDALERSPTDAASARQNQPRGDTVHNCFELAQRIALDALAVEDMLKFA
jgi:hypothetical protein